MSQMSTCSVCKGVRLSYRGAPPHKCPPHWVVWSPELGIIRPEDIYARNPSWAAHQWARRHRVFENLRREKQAGVTVKVCAAADYASATNVHRVLVRADRTAIRHLDTGELEEADYSKVGAA